MPSFATWNVLAQMFIEPKWYPGHDEKEWEYKLRLDRIEKHITQWDPDVIFFQEVTPEMRDELQKRLPHYHFGKLAVHDQSEWPEDCKSREYGNVTAVRIQFGEILCQSANYWHSSGTAYDTSYIVRHTDRSCYFTVNAHLDSQSNQLRKEEAQAMLIRTCGVPQLVIAGDLNTDAREVHDLFADYDMVPTIPPDLAKSTFLDEPAMIDYIYTRGLEVVSSGVVASKPWQNGSDHNLVLADLD